MKFTLPILTLAGLLVAAPGFSQTTTTTTDPANGQTVQDPATAPNPDPAVAPPQATVPPPAPASDRDLDNDLDNLPNEFILAGFVGGSFARSSFQTSVDFGGAFDYLHNGAFGAEFLAGFAPKFKLNTLNGADSDLNNYMANVIAAVPVGSFHAFRPFISGGVGALTISQNGNNANNTDVANAANALFAPSETHFGGNIGGGIMAFTGAFGIRADVRYFSALGTKNGNSNSLVSTGLNGTNLSLLDNVSFWRANVGVAFRF
ncbi:MAG: hypothetical protein ACM3NQ_13620 [Bacteroidales bacterium]